MKTMIGTNNVIKVHAGWGGNLGARSDKNTPHTEEMKQILVEAEANSKQKLEDCGGDFAEFFKLCPQAFRWTCCGTPGDNVKGCDHHGTGCRCDNCPDSSARAMMLPDDASEADRQYVVQFAASLGPPRYEPCQANRFLRLANSPTTEWELLEGVSWTPDAHRHLPRSFRLQSAELLLCWQRTELPSSLALLILPKLFEAEAAVASTACVLCGKASPTQSCSRCKSVWYCGRNCQNSDWERHKKECKHLRKKGARDQYSDDPMMAGVMAAGKAAGVLPSGA